MVGMFVAIHPVVPVAPTVELASTGAVPKDQRSEPTVPTIVLNHYQMLMNCFAVGQAFAVLQHYLVRPMLVRFVVGPIDLEKRVRLSVPMLVRFALLFPSL